jgi:hypothetical protein
MAACGAIVFAGLLAACGPQVSTRGEWQEPHTAKAPFSNVLVVGVAPTSQSRRSFEQALVDLLQKDGAQASASIVVAGAQQALTPETLAGLVGQTGADAVLVTRLASRKVKFEESPDRYGVKTEQPSSLQDVTGLVDLFSTQYHEYEEPGALGAQSTATLQSSLYEAADGERLVYTIETHIKFEETKDDAIGAVTTAIASRLRSEGLIR